MFTIDNRIDATMPKLLLNYLFSSRLPMFADAYSEMQWGISVLPVRSVSAFPCNCLRNNRVEVQTLTIVPIKIIESSLDHHQVGETQRHWFYEHHVRIRHRFHNWFRTRAPTEQDDVRRSVDFEELICTLRRRPFRRWKKHPDIARGLLMSENLFSNALIAAFSKSIIIDFSFQDGRKWINSSIRFW